MFSAAFIAMLSLGTTPIDGKDMCPPVFVTRTVDFGSLRLPCPSTGAVGVNFHKVCCGSCDGDYGVIFTHGVSSPNGFDSSEKHPSRTASIAHLEHGSKFVRIVEVQADRMASVGDIHQFVAIRAIGPKKYAAVVQSHRGVAELVRLSVMYWDTTASQINYSWKPGAPIGEDLLAVNPAKWRLFARSDFGSTPAGQKQSIFIEKRDLGKSWPLLDVAYLPPTLFDESWGDHRLLGMYSDDRVVYISQSPEMTRNAVMYGLRIEGHSSSVKTEWSAPLDEIAMECDRDYSRSRRWRLSDANGVSASLLAWTFDDDSERVLFVRLNVLTGHVEGVGVCPPGVPDGQVVVSPEGQFFAYAIDTTEKNVIRIVSGADGRVVFEHDIIADGYLRPVSLGCRGSRVTGFDFCTIVEYDVAGGFSRKRIIRLPGSE